MRSFFNNNVNSILGAISLHLIVAITFLWFKLGEVREEQKPEVLIEFNEEIKPLEEQTDEDKKASDAGEDMMPSLDARTRHSIASNVAAKMEEEIGTERYEQQVLQELGISTLKTQSVNQTSDPSEDENAIGQQQSTEDKQNESSVPNIIRKDNTTVSYFLENRYHKYLYIPTYRCQGGGTVIIDIVINQQGKVIAAVIAENRSTRDACLLEEAYRSASTAQFNADQKANPKQIGTITYVFLPQ